MFAYIGISFLAVVILISCIRWGVGKAGFRFPRLFWGVCLLAVVVVTLLVPRMVLGILGVTGTLLFSVFLLFLVALWISFSFLPQPKLIADANLILEENWAADESLPAVLTDQETDIAPILPSLTETDFIPVCNTITERCPTSATNCTEPALTAEESFSPSISEAITAFAALENDVQIFTDVEINPRIETSCSQEPVHTDFAAVAPIIETDSALVTAALSNFISDEANDGEDNELPLPIMPEEAFLPELFVEDNLYDDWSTEEAVKEVEELEEAEEPNAVAECEPPMQEQGDEQEVLGTIVKSLPKSDSLDDLLDFAMVQRAQKHFAEALSAMQAAVILYGEKDLESLPYLIIELANIHKEQGQYEQAIQAFQEGQNKLQGEQFAAWREQFVASIAYLRIVRNILLARHQKLVPIEAIPNPIKQEIEEEFAEWNRLS